MFKQICIAAAAAATLVTAPSTNASEGRTGSWHSAAQGAPSLKVCQKLVAANPQSAIANNDLGWAFRQNGNLLQAKKYLRQAIKLDSGLSAAHCNLSVVLLDEGSAADAKAEAQAAVRLDANNPIYHEVLGNAFAKSGERKSAIEEYRAAIKLKPDYENALYNLGETLCDDGQSHEAKFVLSDALKLDPKDDRVVALLDKLSKDGQ